VEPGKDRRRRNTSVVAASIVSILLLSGCSAGGQRYHDMLICKSFASAEAHPTGHPDPMASAMALGRSAAHRPGYLSRRLARDVRAVTSDECNKIAPAVLPF
jgi:hypothetical protein